MWCCNRLLLQVSTELTRSLYKFWNIRPSLHQTVSDCTFCCITTMVHPKKLTSLCSSWSRSHLFPTHPTHLTLLPAIFGCFQRPKVWSKESSFIASRNSQFTSMRYAVFWVLWLIHEVVKENGMLLRARRGVLWRNVGYCLDLSLYYQNVWSHCHYLLITYGSCLPPQVKWWGEGQIPPYLCFIAPLQITNTIQAIPGWPGFILLGCLLALMARSSFLPTERMVTRFSVVKSIPLPSSLLIV